MNPPWWQRRLIPERVLVISALVAGVALVFLVVPGSGLWIRPPVGASTILAMGALLGAARGLGWLTPVLALVAAGLALAALPYSDTWRSGFSLVTAVDPGADDAVVALASLLTALAALALVWVRRRSWRGITVVALGAAIVALAVGAAFSGVLPHRQGLTEPGAAWIIRATLVLVLASGVLVTGQTGSLARGGGLGRWGFVVAAVAVTAGPMGLAQWLHRQEVARVQGVTTEDLSRLQDQLRVQVDATVLSLSRMARSWVWRGRPARNDWKTDAWLFVDYHEEIRAVAWVDPDLQVRWLVPLSGTQGFVGRDLGGQSAHRAVFERALGAQRPAMSPANALVGEGDGFFVAVPIEQGTESAGFIVGFYGMQPLLTAIRKTLAQEYVVELIDDGETVFRSTNAQRAANAGWTVQHPVALYGHEWMLRMTPTRAAVKSRLSWLPESALVLGLALAVLIGVTVNQTQRARATAARLTGEVRRRARVESQLRRSQEDLERRVAERTADLEDKQNELAAINKRLEALATTDDLTGLCNRRRFLEVLDAEFKEAQRLERTFAVSMFDLDRFKPINDTLGHHAGDVVLQRAAAVCAEQLRETDWLARYGGEEFMALITGATAEAAGAVAERMRAAIESLRIEYDGRDVALTASFGVTAIGGADDDLEALLHRADDAVYEAKDGGRNQVVTRLP